MSLTLFFKCPRCSGSRFLNYSTQTAVKTRIHERDQFFYFGSALYCCNSIFSGQLSLAEVRFAWATVWRVLRAYSFYNRKRDHLTIP